MELIKLAGPSSCKITGYKPVDLQYLYGGDGFISSLWPDKATCNNVIDLLLGFLPKKYEQPYRGANSDAAIRTGRYDLMISDWNPNLTRWINDVIVPIGNVECIDVLSPLYRESYVIVMSCSIYFYGVDRQDPLVTPTLNRIELAIPPISNPVDRIISLLKKKYGEPSSSSLDYLLASEQVIKSESEGVGDPPEAS
jgi:hypothetical protein